jgi:hypothetical protein
MSKDKRKRGVKQVKSEQLEQQLFEYLKTLLQELNGQIDRRLVATLFGLVMAIIIHRHRHSGLLISELGGYLLGPGRCRAGTKRISKLLHSEKWKAKLISRFLWHKAHIL